jgi:hypothetical protein
MRLLALLVAALALPAHAATWLWAWDRAEDLRGLPNGIGVAWFAVQFDARDDALLPTWRRPPLHVDPATPLTAVLHVEAFHAGHPPVLDDAAVARWSKALADAARRTGAARVQVDFEARASQLAFYGRVLHGLRARIAPGTFLSVTALASWCGDRAALAALPVDEIVPMYFRMGPRERALWQERSRRPAQLPAACRRAAGLALDEPGLAVAPTVYLFSPRPWRPADFNALQIQEPTP